MSADLLVNLPTDSSYVIKPEELELARKIFVSQTKDLSSTGTSTPIKTYLIAGVLFFIFSLPIVSKLIDGYVKNALMTKAIMSIIFVIVLIIIQKVVLK